MRSIARLLGQGDVESADWKINSLAKLGALGDEAVAIIRRYRDAIHEGVLTEVEKAAFDTLLQSDALFQRAKDAGATLTDVLPADADPAIRNLIEVWQKQAITQTNLAMATLLENTSQVYVETLNRTTFQVLSGAMSGREALVTAVREWSESGVPSIVDRAGRQWTTEAYANMVIRSNVRNVTTAVQMERGRQYGSDLIEVSAHAGARPLCAPYQGRVFSVSGKTEGYQKLSETSYGQPAGLFGINCVLGETLVSGPSKRAAYRRKYSGEIIVIRTSGGNELSVTPNHPILTENGWVNAGLLKEGDNVVSRAILDRKTSSCPNPDHDVARIENLFDTLLHSGDVFEFPASAGYFHGDVSDGEVEVVFPKGLLRDDVEASFLEHGRESGFGLTPESTDSLSGQGGPGHALECPDATPDRVVGGLDVALAPVDTPPLPDNSGGVSPAFGNRHPKSGKIPTDRPLGDSDLGRDFILPHSRVVHIEKFACSEPSLSLQEALPVASGSVDSIALEAIHNRFQGATVFGTNLRGADARTVKLDHIVFIERKSTQSSFVHVYNLETEFGWFYANNIITHNCGHNQYPFWEGVSRQRYAPDDTPEQVAENERAYLESQKQRYLERHIRAAKRAVSVWEAKGDAKNADLARQTVRDRQKTMRDFIAETGRARRGGREQVSPDHYVRVSAFSNGGTVDVHEQHGHGERRANLRIANVLAEHYGEAVRLLPVIQKQKNIDSERNGSLWEMKHPSSTSGKNFVQSGIKEASRQGAENVIILVPRGTNTVGLVDGIRASFQPGRSLKIERVDFLFELGWDLVRLTRRDILTGDFHSILKKRKPDQ
jgi:hypothetical protein